MDLSGLNFGSISAGSLVAVIVVAILRGWLIPRRVLTDRIADAEGRIADAADRVKASDEDADAWKDAYLAERRTNDVQARQITELIDANKTSHAVLAAIPKAMRND